MFGSSQPYIGLREEEEEEELANIKDSCQLSESCSAATAAVAEQLKKTRRAPAQRKARIRTRIGGQGSCH